MLSDGKGQQRRQRFHGRVPESDVRPCEFDGCAETGEFRAPREPGASSAEGGARRWRYFCLDHVRAFNTSYNFFDGMSPDEIANAQSPHPSWDRRTRAFATNASAREADDIVDPLGILRGRYGDGAFARSTTRAGRPLTTADRKALSVLQLDENAGLADIRRRYTELVRRFHPDANGGDRMHERRLQDVIDAYTHLKSAAAFA